MADAAGAVTTPKPEEDPFALEFAKLSEEDANPNGASNETKPDPVTDAAAAEEAGKTSTTQVEIEGILPKVGPDGKPVEETPKPGPAAAAAPAGDTPKPDAAAPQKSDADLLDGFRAILAEAAKPAAQPAPAAVKEETPSPITPYTDEEKALVENYQKEWPDVFAAEQAMRKREYQAVVNHIFTTLRPVLEQVMSQTSTMAAKSHVEQLHAAVPDYAEVAPKVVTWVETLPAALKQSFKHVVAQGEVADVVGLINMYRSATGTQAPAPKPAAQAQDPAAQTPAPKPAAARAIKGLAPVQGKRSGVLQDGIQPDDFDGAFASFSAALDKV